MTDIEIKRKELETAKRIREMGSDGFVAVCDGIACDEDNCPFVVLCSDSKGSEVTPDYVRGFIATREAELAALDKAQESLRGDGNAGPSDGLSHVQTAPHDGLTHEERVRALYGEAFRRTNPSPSLDDFALALIQGGSYSMAFSSELAAEIIYERAATLKAESDRRRGI